VGDESGNKRQGRRFSGTAGGHAHPVSEWLLLSIPAMPLLLGAVLFLSAKAEEHFLSPRSLILGVTRARWNSPEYAEMFVAREYERLLRNSQR
jgi:hypothetical protein